MDGEAETDRETATATDGGRVGKTERERERWEEERREWEAGKQTRRNFLQPVQKSVSETDGGKNSPGDRNPIVS